MQMPKPVNRISLSEQVLKYILSKISLGELLPGDRVIESQICEELHVSSIPVREAIRELVANHILEYVIHRGAQVREVSMQETIDALEVKAVLEPLAVRLAGIERLSKIKSKLQKGLPQMRQTLDRLDHVGFQAANQEFHRLIVESADNAILQRLWEQLAFDIRTKPIMDYLKISDPEKMILEHKDVIDAIEAKDLKKVESMLELHALNLALHLKEKMAENSDEAQKRVLIIKKRRKKA